MIEFALPWVALLLPLPLLAHLWLRPAGLREPALYFPRALQAAGAQPGAQPSARRRVARLLAMALAWIALVAAATGPRWVGDQVAMPASGRDLMLAVDISESMVTQDLELDGEPANRLRVVKRVAGEFLSRREGDRLGLILFGSNAYLHVPLTFDHATVERLLPEARPDSDGDGVPDTIYLCISCHGPNFTITRNCAVCHKKSPHHTNVDDAQNRHCKACHSLVDDYDDGHFIPAYAPGPTTPRTGGGTGFPLNSRGIGAGGCKYCHDDDALSRPLIRTNEELHHGTGLDTPDKCGWCPAFSLAEGQIRVCETCHGPTSLHNIQADSPKEPTGTIIPPSASSNEIEDILARTLEHKLRTHK